MADKDELRIGINGFGRIGRLICRAAFEREGITVVAINACYDVDYLAYLLKHDSSHGHSQFSIDFNKTNSTIIVNSKEIKCFSTRDPECIPWSKWEVDVVCESTGAFTTIPKAKAHIKNGAKKVIITAPSKDAPMFVMGANHQGYTKNTGEVVSCASCTTNCVAPIVKIIHESFGIKHALMTTIHASTKSQSVVDGTAKAGKNWRLGRGAMQNIIPTSTGAAIAVGKVLPALDGKITGISLRVPTPNVSLVDLTVALEKETTFEELKEVVKHRSETDMLGIVGYTEDQLVSTDFGGNSHSCVFDADASIAMNGKFMKFLCWYDNEYGYSNRVIDLALHMYEIDTV